jgi:hypothetical protein
MKPVTSDHPSVAVTADNWKQHAKGVVGKALRDGEHLAFDLVLMDAALIAEVESGKRELSNGYACDLAFEDGQAADGTAYQAVQRHIRGNHVAVVDAGRAGPECRIGDAAIDKTLLARSDAFEPLDGGSHVATKTITFDGLPLEVTDAAEAAINKLIAQLADAASAKATTATELATARTETVAKDAEIVTLKQQLADAKITPAQLRDAAKVYAGVCAKATALGVKFADEADGDAIMKAVVDAKMGDAAKDYDAKDVATAFSVLTKDTKAVVADPLRAAISDGVTARLDDAEQAATDARAAMIADLKGAAPAKAA